MTMKHLVMLLVGKVAIKTKPENPDAVDRSKLNNRVLKPLRQAGFIE